MPTHSTAAPARATGPQFDLRRSIMPADYPAEAARRHPDRPALICKDRSLSFVELDGAVGAFVGWAHAAGIVAGDRIAYLGRNDDLFIVVLLGCMRAGIVLVPLNWRHTAAEIGFALRDSGSCCVMADGEFASVIADANPGRIDVIYTDAGDPQGLRAQLAASHMAPRADAPLGPCLLCYTSGTTGAPKAVQLSQLAFACGREMERQAAGYRDWNDSEIVLAAMPLFHIGGMSWALGALARGLTCVIGADAAPATMLDLCTRHQVSRLFAVPTVIHALIDEMRARAAALPALRGIHYGAAPMDSNLLRAAMAQFGCRFVQHFGMTESCGCGTLLAPADHDPSQPEMLQSVGRPLPGVSIEIRHPDGTHICAVLEHGEIWIHGKVLMDGYAGRPQATAEVLQDGWYRSGDGGFLNHDGFLFLTDRIKDMIISGGENIYPKEIEEVLRRHPTVADVAVFGRPDPRWGERIVAAVELRDGAQTSVEELAAHMRQFLASYKIPREFELNVTLPRTASGKVQRSAARKQHLSRLTSAS